MQEARAKQSRAADRERFGRVGACLMVGWAVLFIALAAQTFLKPVSEWYDVYVRAALDLLSGADIYQVGRAFLYPPFSALAAVPFTPFSEPVARAIWFAINFACLFGLLRWSWRLADGPDPAEASRAEWTAAVLGVAATATFVLNAFAHQQTDVAIAFLLIAGCLTLKPRPAASGVLLGLGAAVKATPMLWAPYLLWRRHYVAAGVLAVIAVGVNLLPDLVNSSPSGRPWLLTWLERFVVPTQGLHSPVGTWGSALIYNQSIAGMVGRFTSTYWTWSAEGVMVTAAAPLWSPQYLKPATYALLVGLLGLSVYAMARARCRKARPISGIMPERASLEFGGVLMLMLLLSPMSSMAHYATLILPSFCLARAAIVCRDRVLLAMVCLAALLALISNKDPLGDNLYTLALWFGLPTWAVLTLWAASLYALFSGLWASESGSTQPPAIEAG